MSLDLAVRTPEKVRRLALGVASHDVEFGVAMDLADDFGLVGTLQFGDNIIVRSVRERDSNRLDASIANVGTTAAACSPPRQLTARTANYPFAILGVAPGIPDDYASKRYGHTGNTTAGRQSRR